MYDPLSTSVFPQIIKMMLMVLVLYCVCWLPIKLYQFLLNYAFISHCSETQFKLMIYSYIGCHWLAMANSTVNPIVYSFMSKSFRVGVLCQLFLWSPLAESRKRIFCTFSSKGAIGLSLNLFACLR